MAKNSTACKKNPVANTHACDILHALHCMAAQPEFCMAVRPEFCMAAQPEFCMAVRPEFFQNLSALSLPISLGNSPYAKRKRGHADG